MVSYFCDIPDGNLRSAVRLVVVVKRPYVGTLVTREDIFSGQMDNRKSMSETKMVGRSLLEIARNNTASFWDENKAVQQK